MKAITIDRYGPPDVLRFAEVPDPSPGPGEIRVRVHAASVNAADWRMMRADPFLARLANGLLRPKFPIPGGDVAGVVEALGPGATLFRPGDAVFGDLALSGMGAFAEQVCAPERLFAPKPPNLSFEEAAACPMAACTAVRAVRHTARIGAGQKVLVQGAGGGVGLFCVQLAVHDGAEVTAVCGPGSVDVVRAAGAQRVIDYTREDFVTEGARYDVILGVNGHRSLSDYKRSLAPGGAYFMVGGDNTQIFQALLFGRWSFLGSGKRIGIVPSTPSRDDLLLAGKLLEAGALRPVIDRRFPLSQVPDAIRHLEAGHTRGKVVIEVTGGG
jgi:NADPH:quinone reductase-like Zn-dependent oxidoreductase